MIYVGCAIKQDEIIKTLNELGYSLAKKSGVKMQFDTKSDNIQDAISKAKNAIKATTWGKVIYFTVTDKPL